MAELLRIYVIYLVNDILLIGGLGEGVLRGFSVPWSWQVDPIFTIDFRSSYIFRMNLLCRQSDSHLRDYEYTENR